MARDTRSSSRTQRSSGRRSSSGSTSNSRSTRRVQMPRSNPRRNRGSSGYGQISTVRVGDMRSSRRRKFALLDVLGPWLLRMGIVVVLALLVVVAGMLLSRTSLFSINQVEVTGVEHLTAAEVTELAAVPATSTLLRLDASEVEQRLESNPWIEDAQVNRKFPSTLELAITERAVAAVVEVPVANEDATEDWAISSDGIWLMLIPKQGTEDAGKVSAYVYEDASQALRIIDVAYSASPAVGAVCDDPGVSNALKIIEGLSIDLADLIDTISATDVANTTLNLDSGLQIAFGAADNVRDKERVCLQLMADHPNQIAYINVRVLDHPTWRSL